MKNSRQDGPPPRRSTRAERDGAAARQAAGTAPVPVPAGRGRTLITYGLLLIWLGLMSLAAASIWNPAWLQALSRPGAEVEARGRRMAGDELARRGQFAGAIEKYRSALAIDPGSIEARVNLAVACRESGALDEARRLLVDTLAEGTVESGTIRYHLGLVHERSEQSDLALATFRQAVAEPDPTRASAWRRIAALQLRAGRPLEARQAFEEALRLLLDPAEDYLAALVAARATIGDEPEQLAAIEALLERGASPADLARYDTVLIDEVRARDPEIGRTHAVLAGVCAGLGDLEAAREHCRQALAVNPRDEVALKVQARLEAAARSG